MVEAIGFTYFVVQCTAHDQPHHHFYPFRTCFPQIFEMRNAGQGFGIAGEIVEKAGIEFAVNESRARALQLMRHATGAEDHHPEVALETLNRFTDGFPQHVAAMTGRDGVDYDIDAKRYHGTWPFRSAPEHQRQWNREPVIDLHFIHDCDVEFIKDGGLDDVRCELGMALHRRDWARAPALIRDWKFRCAADRESRHNIE